MTRDIPCGNCDCGVYSELSMLNKKARAFGALLENERLDAIPVCKKDKQLKCAGYTDFHNMITHIDKHIEGAK